MRDLFYIDAYPDNNEVVYNGMEFSEFIKYAPKEIKNILLLKSEYYGASLKSKTRFKLVEEADIDRLLNDDIYSYGDFCWVDFDERKNVEELEPIEIAELLYLGHKYKPVNSPFFEKIQNRYAYLAHDDGYFCRLYCRDYSDFGEIVANKVADMAAHLMRRKKYPFPGDLKGYLVKLAEGGLLIDFSKISKVDKEIKIPIFRIGKFLDMDEIVNDYQRFCSCSDYSACLVQRNKSWAIDDIIDD